MTCSRLRTAVGSVAVAALLIGAAMTSPAAAAPAAPATSGATVPGDARHCTSEPITAGYYRMWRDVATTKPEDRAPNVQRLDDIPPEVDIVSAFATKPAEDPEFWSAMRSTYLPKLHSQGTKVVFTLWIDDFADADVPLTQAGYEAYARDIYQTYIKRWRLDGLDIDTEQMLTGDRLERAAGILRALGRYIGPKSGTDKLLILDTNYNGDHPLVSRVAPYLSYVWVQSYGRSQSSLQPTWNSFAPYIHPCQYFIGFSFYEERGARWGDVNPPLTTSRAAAYARWQPTGARKGGTFAYAIDRDGKVEGDDTITRTTFSWLRELAAIQRSSTPR